MQTLEEAVVTYEQCAFYAKQEKLSETYRYYTQLAAWLRELQERRKANSCEGCVNESGKSNLLVCYTCRRHYHYADLYKERRTDD